MTMLADRISRDFDMQCTASLPAAAHREIVETMALEGSKWDVHFGGGQVLAPFAITISRATGQTLFRWAEGLTSELMAMETCLAARPELWPALGVPRALRRMLRSDEPWTPAAARIVRYDFHPTDEGWKISEVNSDVPGGLGEASTFARAMALHFSDTAWPGDPLEGLAEALAATGRRGCVAGVSAPGLPADRQVVAAVAAALRARGIRTVLTTPDQMQWDAGEAFVQAGEERIGVRAIYRFFQGEWADRIGSPQWRYVFRGGRTPVCNPGSAILTESKRLPLVWSELPVEHPTWSRLLPRTVEPWRLRALGGNWVRKGGYSNNGEAIVNGAWSRSPAVASACVRGWLHPRGAVAQRKFAPVALATPDGPGFPCFGVYTIDGRACGIYGRISARPMIDGWARDVAILVRD